MRHSEKNRDSKKEDELMNTPDKKTIANSIYKENKELIKNVADSEQLTTCDKTQRRTSLNDLLDSLSRDIQFFVLREKITQKQADQVIERLTNYVIKRHNK